MFVCDGVTAIGDVYVVPPMLSEVAPVTVQLSDKDWPAVIVEGVAMNEVMIGTGGGGGGVTAGLIVNARSIAPIPPALVAVMVALEAPATVGVPESNPVLLIAKPAGNPVAEKNVGELEAAN